MGVLELDGQKLGQSFSPRKLKHTASVNEKQGKEGRFSGSRLTQGRRKKGDFYVEGFPVLEGGKQILPMFLIASSPGKKQKIHSIRLPIHVAGLQALPYSSLRCSFRATQHNSLPHIYYKISTLGFL